MIFQHTDSIVPVNSGTLYALYAIETVIICSVLYARYISSTTATQATEQVKEDMRKSRIEVANRAKSNILSPSSLILSENTDEQNEQNFDKNEKEGVPHFGRSSTLMAKAKADKHANNLIKKGMLLDKDQ